MAELKTNSKRYAMQSRTSGGANTMNMYTNAGFSVLTGGAGYYISGVRASMAFAGATSVTSEMSGLSNMVNPEKIKRTKKIR